MQTIEQNSSTTLGGYAFTEECVNAFLNLIISSKIVADYEKYQDVVLPSSMKDYVIEWFLVNFGN